jgi:hypothetical protein
MKVAKTAFACFLIVLAISLTSAQSGRVTPAPTPSSLPPTSPKPRTDAQVFDRNPPKYKLVFSAVSEFSVFVDQLNQHGEQGYRLKSVIYGWQKSDRKNYFLRPAAILQLDETKYEYAWFKTTSYWYFGVDGFDEKYAEMAKQGFRLVDHFYTGGTCEPGDCAVNDLFLLEKPKGVARPREFRMAGRSPGRRMQLDLSAELNEGVAAGFYPISLVSKFQVLLESVNSEDQPLEKPNIRWTNLNSQINKLGRQGYRLAFMHDEGIVMYRDPGSSTPLEYEFVKVGRGKLEKRIKALEEGGATFRTIYRDQHWSGEKLIFEKKLISDGGRRELRALRFEFRLMEDQSGKSVQIELTPEGKEALSSFNDLVGQGFVVRTLFGSDHVGVLLER